MVTVTTSAVSHTEFDSGFGLDTGMQLYYTNSIVPVPGLYRHSQGKGRGPALGGGGERQKREGGNTRTQKRKSRGKGVGGEIGAQPRGTEHTGRRAGRGADGDPVWKQRLKNLNKSLRFSFLTKSV